MIELIIPNTNPSYHITQEGNKIIIVNDTGMTGNIFVSLYKRSNCSENEYEVLFSERAMYEEQFVIRIPIVDGLYKVAITADDITEEFLFPIYENLLLSLVDDLTDYFCDNCGCKQGCREKVDKRLQILTKVLLFYTINKKYVGGILDKAFDCSECVIYEALQCHLYESTLGKEKELETLFNTVVGTFYFSMYYSQTLFADEEDNVKKFKFNKLKDCIASHGVSVECIKNKIDNMATFTMAYSAYVNLPPTVGNYSTSADHAAETVLTAAMFTSSTTPAYSDPEGNPADAIRIDTLPTNGATLLLNSVAITATGTIVTIADINAGKLKLKGSTSNNTAHNAVFTFSVRDTGSMIFSS